MNVPSVTVKSFGNTVMDSMESLPVKSSKITSNLFKSQPPELEKKSLSEELFKLDKNSSILPPIKIY